MMRILGMVMFVLGIAGAVSAGAESPATPPTTKPSTQPATELKLDLGNGARMKLALIAAGTFLMGSPKDE